MRLLAVSAINAALVTAALSGPQYQTDVRANRLALNHSLSNSVELPDLSFVCDSDFGAGMPGTTKRANPHAESGFGEMHYRFEKLEPRLLLAQQPPLTFSTAVPSTTFTVQLDPTGASLQVLFNSSLLFSEASSALGSAELSFNLDGAGDALTVNQTNGTPEIAGGIVLQSTSPTSHTLEVIGTNSGNDSFTVNSNQLTFNGGTINYSSFSELELAPGLGTDSLTVNSGSVTVLPQTPNSGILIRNFSNLDVAAGASLLFATAASHNDRTLVETGSLSVQGQLDLGGNDMIIHSGNLPAISNLLATGYANGQWNGVGLASSAANADTTHLTTLGVISNAFYPSVGEPQFDGINPLASDIIVRYTYYGDTNLDGQVDGSDYSNLDNGFLQQLTGWVNGDLNYDGQVDGSDYTLMDNSFNMQGPSLGSEPVSSYVYLPVSAQTLNDNQIQISWVNPPVTDITSIEVVQSADGVNFQTVATLAPNQSTYTASNLTPGTVYYYALNAVTPSGTTVLYSSGVATATTSALISPGSGFTGATVPDPAIQHIDATLPGANEMAIANWDVVPYQTFDNLFNVGVVAFDSNGIKEIDISVNGGSWVKVTKMTLNPQTANNSGIGNPDKGVVEYWATLDASTFSADGPIEVRAIAYPNNGKARVLNSLMLNVNAKHSLPAAVSYVSPNGSDATGNGTQANPYATISKAVSSINTAQGNVNGATIYLAAGSYTYGWNGYNGAHLASMTSYITIAPVPGVSRAQVSLTGYYVTDGFYDANVHLQNLTIASPATTNVLASMGGYLWLDGCNLIGAGRTVSTNQIGGFSNIYATDSKVSASQYGINSATLVRNDLIDDISGVALQNDVTVLNTSVSNINGAGTNWHQDVYQFYNPNLSDVILDGITATTNITAQGIFGGRGTVSILDLAIVNCVIAEAPTSVGNVFTFEVPTQNMYVLDSNFTGNTLWATNATNPGQGFNFSAVDVVIQATKFSKSPGPIAGVTYE